ncbi:MAG: copper amine oxidase N-terminal domain-containing protein [Clostridiales bacterium]|nr:copper amine oxidase N-terminal domain-containing protein [Clostridiales bacterium]
MENNPSIAIYESDIQENGSFAIEMLSGANWVKTDYVKSGDPIRLLMVNGGFVPKAEIIIENSRTLVPVRIISEILGAKVEWDGNARTVEISDRGVLINLKIGSADASAGGKAYTLDAPAKIFSDRTYVPIRFIAEALGAEVGYIDNLSDAPGYHGRYPQGKPPFTIATVERSNSKPQYTAEDGLSSVKEASAKTYQQVVDYLEETSRAFDDIDKDYDSQSIIYTGKNLGRYYIYQLEGFEEFQIYFNTFTGAIYSQKAALPFFYIDEGFINIGWLYQ